MSTSSALQIAPAARISAANHIRRLLAAASVLALAGIGVYALRTGQLADRIVAIYLTFGPAAIYAFGYFYWLPDVLGAPGRKLRAPLLHRWSSFVRSAAIGSAVVWVAWIGALVKQDGISGSRGGIAGLVATILVPPLLIFVAVIASEEYVSRAIAGPTDELRRRHTPLTRAVGQIASPITRFLCAKRSLSLGGALVLASLLLNITLMSSCGDDPRKGYEIVTGKAVWVTVQQTVRDEGALTTIASQVGRAMYVLDLVIAAACLSTVLIGRRGARPFRNLAMVHMTAVLAFIAICDFTLGYARLVGMPPGIWALVLLLCTCILPPFFWIWRARQPEHWDHTRLALMIAVLPVMFFTITFGFFAAAGDPNLYGLGSFLLGMLLLWWGAVQTHWEGGDSQAYRMSSSDR